MGTTGPWAPDRGRVAHLVRRAWRNVESHLPLSVEPDVLDAGRPEPRLVGTGKVVRIGIGDVPGRGAEVVACGANRRRGEARGEHQRARQHRPSPAVTPHAPES